MTKSSLAPGFLTRIKKIFQDKGITLEALAVIAQVDCELFQYYDSGDIPLDELTLHRILDYSEVDWLWLEHGYESDPVIESHQKMGVRYTC